MSVCHPVPGLQWPVAVNSVSLNVMAQAVLRTHCRDRWHAEGCGRGQGMGVPVGGWRKRKLWMQRRPEGNTNIKSVHYLAHFGASLFTHGASDHIHLRFSFKLLHSCQFWGGTTEKFGNTAGSVFSLKTLGLCCSMDFPKCLTFLIGSYQSGLNYQHWQQIFVNNRQWMFHLIVGPRNEISPISFPHCSFSLVVFAAE